MWVANNKNPSFPTRVQPSPSIDLNVAQKFPNYGKRQMKFSVSWSERLARVDYFGEITNEDIQRAHFKLNGDRRFYNCQRLILDVTECSLAKVNVPKLVLVIATDLGASKTIKSMKVAMIANDPDNIEKVSDYIEKSRISPWVYKLFHSVSDARSWLES